MTRQSPPGLYTTVVIPVALKERLVSIAHDRGISLGHLLCEAAAEKYAIEYEPLKPGFPKGMKRKKDVQ